MIGICTSKSTEEYFILSWANENISQMKCNKCLWKCIERWKSTKSLENFSSTQSRDFSRFHSIETIRIFNITEPCQRLKWIHSFLVQIRTMNSTWFKLFNAQNFQLPFTNRCTNLLIHLPLDTMINGNPAISIGVCLLLSVVHTIQSE